MASARPPGSASGGLAPGTVVGGRFEVERAVGEDSLGTLLAAKDQKTGRAIAVRVLAPGLIATPEAIETLRASVKDAASVQHRGVVATYGMGADKASGARYVATEWVDGQSLAQLVAARAAGAQPLSLRGAYNIVAHVCKALTAAAEKNASHGALRPSVVFVTASGRVKVSQFGVDRAIVATAGPAALGAGEQAYLAPEVKAGAAPTPQADVFGVGGVLYALLTGRSAGEDFVAPSEVHPEATPEVDALLLQCLASDPATRFASPDDVRNAMVSLSALAPAGPDSSELGVDVDVDVDIGSVPPPAATQKPGLPKPSLPNPSLPKPAAVPSATASGRGIPRPGVSKPPAPSARPAAPGAAPKVGARVALDEGFRGDAPLANAAPALSAEVDLGNLLSKITENDAPRWMVVKDNLDHGPFSGRELVQLILKGEVLGDHGLLNMDSGERRKIAEHPEFIEFVAQWKLKKADADHKVALQVSAKKETTSNVTKALILLGVAGALVAGVVFAIIQFASVAPVETGRTEQELADLYERGEIEITGSAGILPDPPATARRSGRRGGGARGGSSYEDAMNQVVNLGDVSGGGSMSRLSPGQVAGVMNQNINRLVPCLSQGSGGGAVRIDLAIAGSGQVLGASVRNGTPAFQSCVVGRVRAIRFPSFGAPRMGASYTFSAN